jgi:peptidoglycan/xylan/chitin deacetylase (PgdA/CDA1 family)
MGDALPLQRGLAGAACAAAASLALVAAAPAKACRPAPHRLVSHGPRSARAVALTFDDGPSRFTPGVLRALRRGHAHATFFVVGSQLRRRKRLLRRIVAAGDEVGNHTQLHRRLRADGSGAAWEIGTAQSRIERAGGPAPCLFRPPYLAVTPEIVAVAGGLGLWTIGADVLSDDWLGFMTPRAIARRVLARVRPGSIVLLHDGLKPRPATVAALPAIVAGLERRGYRLVTVSRLLGMA